MALSVTINGKDYASFAWSDGEVTMGRLLSKWLDEHKVWDGPDRNFADFFDEDALRPLENWGQSDNTWLTFHFNSEKIALEFKQFFSDWQPNMIHGVIIKDPAPLVSDVLGKIKSSGMEKWFKEKDLVNGADYCASMAFGEAYDDPTPLLFEFTNPRLATMFKLTWGGHVDV